MALSGAGQAAGSEIVYRSRGGGVAISARLLARGPVYKRTARVSSFLMGNDCGVKQRLVEG